RVGRLLLRLWLRLCGLSGRARRIRRPLHEPFKGLGRAFAAARVLCEPLKRFVACFVFLTHSFRMVRRIGWLHEKHRATRTLLADSTSAPMAEHTGEAQRRN